MSGTLARGAVPPAHARVAHGVAVRPARDPAVTARAGGWFPVLVVPGGASAPTASGPLVAAQAAIVAPRVDRQGGHLLPRTAGSRADIDPATGADGLFARCDDAPGERYRTSAVGRIPARRDAEVLGAPEGRRCPRMAASHTIRMQWPAPGRELADHPGTGVAPAGRRPR